MDENLTAEQRDLWQHLTTFSQEKLAPFDAQLSQGQQTSAEAYQLLVNEGLPELGLAKPFGSEASFSEQILVLAAIAQGSVSAAVMLASTWTARPPYRYTANRLNLQKRYKQPNKGHWPSR